MEMLHKIGSVDKVADFVKQEFDAGRVIFGLGHAVYDTDDPRAQIVASMSKVLEERSGKSKWYEISAELEKTGKAEFRKRKESDIYVNVDFYSGSLYNSMGIPADLFTPVFAISRIAGWCAHVIEEQFAGAAPKPLPAPPRTAPDQHAGGRPETHQPDRGGEEAGAEVPRQIAGGVQGERELGDRRRE